MIGAPDRLTPEDLTSLDERLGLLLPVRAGLTVALLLLAATGAGLLGPTPPEVLLASLCYLALAGAAEWLARWHRANRLPLHRLLLPVDAVFLVYNLVPAGDAVRATILLLAVYLIAVTLLASVRSGVRAALWESFLLVACRWPSIVTAVGSLQERRPLPVPPLAETVAAVAGLWAVTLCTGFFSSVNERELRRGKTELGALAGMAAELERHVSGGEILDRLLLGLAAAFPFDRAVAVWDDGTSVAVRALHATRTRRAGRVRWPGTGGHRAARRAPAAPAEPVALEAGLAGAAWADAAAEEAWAGRSPVLVRTLDRDSNPTLSRLLPEGRHVVVLPLGPDGDHRGVVALSLGVSPYGAGLPRRTLLALTQFSTHISLVLRNARLMEEREQAARRDSLTGLANRRHLDEVMDAEVSRTVRSGEPLSLVVLDIDRFKAINDTLGHRGGDQVLREVGRVLAASVRKMDTAARFGGEEFALVLPSCGPDGAMRVAETVRVAIAADAALVGVTVSAGVATLPDHAADAGTLVQAADDALYRSKDEGRNRVSVASGAAPVGDR